MDRCAWCDAETDEGTRLSGIPYHWRCLKRRMVMVREPPAAIDQRRRATAKVFRYLRADSVRRARA